MEGHTNSDRQREGRATGFLAGLGWRFRWAWRGVVVLLRTQCNARIHAGATAAVIVAGLALDVSRTEWCLLVLAMGLVWATEAINTAIEMLADAISTADDPRLGRVKDVAAGGVLLASMAAAIVGLLVLGPRLAATLGL